jgi:spore coat protein U-like protein
MPAYPVTQTGSNLMSKVASLRFRVASAALAIACLLVVSAPAQAGSAVGTIGVELNVTSACVVNGASSVTADFGSAGKILFADQPGLFGDTDASLVATGGGSGLSVQCSPGSTPSLTVGSGAHDGGGLRHVASGTNTVAYHLFSDAARTSEITIGQQLSLGTATSSAINVPIYARTNSAGTVLAAGKYTDTVQVTLSW